MPGKKAVRKRGFTLLEAVIALALWAVLSAGIAVIWQSTSRASVHIIQGQDAFENARASMDAILTNLHMADTILLETDYNHVLKRLTLTQRNPSGNPHNYIFYFNIHARPGDAKFHRLEFGLHNEFASQIAKITLERKHKNRMSVTVITDGESAITLTGSADIRYKNVTIIQSP
jgi:prepilin-type N-terminal cleavage/methylation domain-containing protein